MFLYIDLIRIFEKLFKNEILKNVKKNRKKSRENYWFEKARQINENRGLIDA